MQLVNIYDQEVIRQHTRIRTGERKLGECVQLLNHEELAEGLANSTASFVLLGIPEDIGVRANYGRAGAQSAWLPALSNILNIQSNSFFSGEELLVLGHVNCEDLLKTAEKCNGKTPESILQLRKLVEELDDRVSTVIRSIVSAGMVPIIIGGGHNNAYGNIKGAALGLKESGKQPDAKINCINSDAHADFRALEGRHSGNGFSYAMKEGFLENYAVVGLHENYNSDPVLDEMRSTPQIHFSFFEDIFIREEMNFKHAVLEAIDFTDSLPCGIELDMDTVQNIPSSAKTSSGISANQARQFIYLCGKNSNPAYLHIAEAAPVLSHIKTDNKTGKLIAYLVSDFIKGIQHKQFIS